MTSSNTTSKSNSVWSSNGSNGLSNLATVSSLVENNDILPSLACFNVADPKSTTAILTHPEIQQLASAGQIITGQNGQLYVMVPSEQQFITNNESTIISSSNGSSPPDSPSIHTTTTSANTMLLSNGTLLTDSHDSVQQLPSSRIIPSKMQANVNNANNRSRLMISRSVVDATNNDSMYASIAPTNNRRKVSHNEVERRRRDQINLWISELNKMLPLEEQQKSQHQSKGGILKRVCEYLRGLEDTLKALEATNSSMKQEQVDQVKLQENIRHLEEENDSLKSQLQLVEIKSLNGGLAPTIVSSLSNRGQTSVDNKNTERNLSFSDTL